MLATLYRLSAGTPHKRPTPIEREGRGYQASLEAAGTIGTELSVGESLDDFQGYFESLVTVYRCAWLNAASVASGHLRFYRVNRVGESTEIVDRNHELLRLFRRPNPFMSGRRWVFATQLSKELSGITFSEIVLKPSRELWVLNAAKMKARLSEDKRRIAGYMYKPGYKDAKPFRAEDVWMDRFHNPNSEVEGMPPLRAAAQHVYANQLLEEGMVSILKNGMRLSGVLSVDVTATDEQIDHLIAQIKEMYQGVKRWGRTLVAAGGQRFQSLSMEPEKLQAQEMRKWNAHMVMRAFGIWPLLFGDVDTSATRENATTQERLHHFYTTVPRALDLQDEITERLLPALRIPGIEDVRAELDYSKTSVLRGLAREEAQAMAELADRDALTPNDIRDIIGYEPVPWGDVPYEDRRAAEARGNDSQKARDLARELAGYLRAIPTLTGEAA